MCHTDLAHAVKRVKVEFLGRIERYPLVGALFVFARDERNRYRSQFLSRVSFLCLPTVLESSFLVHSLFGSKRNALWQQNGLRSLHRHRSSSAVNVREAYQVLVSGNRPGRFLAWNGDTKRNENNQI